MTIDELISELQRIKDTYGDMEVRVLTTDYDYDQDVPSVYPIIRTYSVTLDKNNFVVTDRAPEDTDPHAYENTRYLRLGDFTVQGLTYSNIRDTAEKCHALKCARCNLLHRALSRAEKKNGKCNFCQLHGPTSQLPYYSNREYYCSVCHYTYPTGEKKSTCPRPLKP